MPKKPTLIFAKKPKPTLLLAKRATLAPQQSVPTLLNPANMKTLSGTPYSKALNA